MSPQAPSGVAPPPSYSPQTAEYFGAHAIDPAIAAACGCVEQDGAPAYWYPGPERQEFLRPHKCQPKGLPLELWWPCGTEGTAALVCEGEPDALAAASVLFRCNGNGLEPAPNLPAPLAGLVPTAIPGTPTKEATVVAGLQDAGISTAYVAMDADGPGRKKSDKLVVALAEAQIKAIPLTTLAEGADLADSLAACSDRTEWLAETISGAASEPSPLEVVLELVEGFVRRYVVMDDHQAVAAALWVAHTHALDAAFITPYLYISSAEKQCGKTVLLDALSRLAARPWFTSNASPAVLARKVDQDPPPTLLLDESDTAFGADKEASEALRGVLNSGFRRGGNISRCDGPKFEARDSPRSRQTRLPASVDACPTRFWVRSVSVCLKRRMPDERVERFRDRKVNKAAAPIEEALRTWADHGPHSSKNSPTRNQRCPKNSATARWIPGNRCLQSLTLREVRGRSGEGMPQPHSPRRASRQTTLLAFVSSLTATLSLTRKRRNG